MKNNNYEIYVNSKSGKIEKLDEILTIQNSGNWKNDFENAEIEAIKIAKSRNLEFVDLIEI